MESAHLGDAHNFGRRVARRDGRIVKPRTLFWEWLALSAESPLRALLAERAAEDGLGRGAFGFLPDLQFFPPRASREGEVEHVNLAPLPDRTAAERRDLARITGRSIALWSFLGLADLHWENLALGLDARGAVVLTPLDVEMILADLARPTETKLLPDADPEVREVCRHAAGVRRVLPYLGKPVDPGDLAAMAADYLRTLAFLGRRAPDIARVLDALPELREAPIRVCLRGTGDYVRASRERVWPPLLAAEREQLARGDIPYFFRLYGKPCIHYYVSRDLTRVARLPLQGDVPKLDPLLDVSRGLRARSRKALREEGLFTLLGAFDHPSFTGEHEHEGITITFRARTLLVKLPSGEELRVARDLRAFVSSVYLPCRCGEVRSVMVPEVTVCEGR